MFRSGSTTEIVSLGEALLEQNPSAKVVLRSQVPEACIAPHGEAIEGAMSLILHAPRAREPQHTPPFFKRDGSIGHAQNGGPARCLTTREHLAPDTPTILSNFADFNDALWWDGARCEKATGRGSMKSDPPFVHVNSIEHDLVCSACFGKGL